MKFLYLCFLYFLINISLVQGDNGINEIKNNMHNDIIEARNKYLSIKNSVLSPYNKASLSYNYYIDSLKILSTHLEMNRKEVFSLINEALSLGSIPNWTIMSDKLKISLSSLENFTPNFLYSSSFIPK